MIDEWTITRIWQEIEILQGRVRDLEKAREVDEEKAYQANLDELDRQDGKWYREVNDLG